ncbi:Multiple sugar-binding protein precursor [compost metagenome]
MTPPTTYDELLDVVEKLNAKQITPITIAGKERWPILHWFSYLAQRIGGTEPFDKAKNNEADFTQDSFVRAGEMLRELAIDKKAFVNGFLGLDNAAAESLFMNGKAAMYLQGEWAMEAFLKDEFADKVGFIPFPAVNGGEGNMHIYQGGFGVGMAISSKTNQDAAYTAIGFLSSPEQRKEIYEGANISPMKNPGLDESNMPPLAYEYDKAISENLEGFFGYYDQTLDAKRADQFLDLVGAIVGQSNIDLKEELAKIK